MIFAKTSAFIFPTAISQADGCATRPPAPCAYQPTKTAYTAPSTIGRELIPTPEKYRSVFL